MNPVLVTLLLVSVAFADTQHIIHGVPMNANFEIVIRVEASSSLSKTDSGFVESTLDKDCGELNMCVQLLAPKRSLQIYGDPKTANAKILIIPEDDSRENFRVAIVPSVGCYPKPYSVLFTESFCAKRDFMDALTLVFDEDIKEIKLEGHVSKYLEKSAADGAEVFIPYEQIDGQKYKLLRITGKVEDTSISFTLINSAGVEANHIIQPLNNMQVRHNPVRFIRWERKCLPAPCMCEIY